MSDMTSPGDASAQGFPYVLQRVGTIMTPEPGNALEAEGVLNPATGRGPDGELYLLPRIVATGNVSRVGLARVVVTDGVPTGLERQGVVLEPATSCGFRPALSSEPSIPVCAKNEKNPLDIASENGCAPSQSPSRSAMRYFHYRRYSAKRLSHGTRGWQR